MVAIIKELDATRPVTCGVNLMVINMASKGKGIYKEEGGREKETTGGGDKKVSSTLFNLMTSFVGTGMNKAANSKKADAVTTPLFDSLISPATTMLPAVTVKKGRSIPKEFWWDQKPFHRISPKTGKW
jgi:hypothetical protein